MKQLCSSVGLLLCLSVLATPLFTTLGVAVPRGESRATSSTFRPFVRAEGFDLASGERVLIARIPKGVVLTDILATGETQSYLWRVILQGNEVEVGNAGELTLPIGADGNLLSLKTGLMSQGSLKVVFVCLTGQCRNKILVTGYRP